MDITIEAKLKAKERNKLDDSMFGLPKDRKYPLNDEAHVRKAIQFFKFCDRTKRPELASNINKKLKEYNMSITVDKTNPFVKYANKSYVTVKEASEIYLFDVPDVVRDNFNFIKNITIKSWDDMAKVESLCKVVIDEALEHCVNDDTYVSVIEKFNEYIAGVYNDFISYSETSPTMYNMIESSVDELINTDIDDIYGKLPNVMNMLETSSNKYHSYRACCEAIAHIEHKECMSEEDSLMVGHIVDTIRCVKNNIESSISNSTTTLFENNSIFDMPQEWIDIDAGHIELCREHSLSKNDLYIINQSISKFFGREDANDFISPFSNIEILPIRVAMISPKLTIFIDSDDRLFLNRITYRNNLKYADRIYSDEYLGVKRYFAHSNSTGKDYLITKFKNTEVYDLALIEVTPDTLDYLSGAIEVGEAQKIKLIRISESITSFTKNILINNVVSEAFTVNEDGDIKIIISPKNSYMDSYSSNHKMLVENWKNKNYEAMKKNLAYVFALIAVIERSDGYKARDPEVMKARTFAINDFKTYLKHLQSVEPDFDFVEYYDASDYDKKIINVPKSTIIGIKKLMRTILI